jgi:hypothetical protein
LGEIRRTMAAVRQQSAEHQVDQVIVCGSDALAKQAAALAKELEIPVDAFDPIAVAPSGLSSKGVAAESLGRFSAVLGMALGEADRRAPIVDFANVRRKLETRRFTRVHALAAAAACAVVLWFASSLWSNYAEQGRKLTELQGKIDDANAQANMYKNVVAQSAAVDRWLATDVNWLDELDGFAHRVRPQPLSSKEFPVNDDAVIMGLTLQRPPGTNPEGGKMDIQAVAKSPAAVAALEKRLRDGTRTVATGGSKQEKLVPGYDWTFGLDIRVPREEDAEEEAPKK